MKRMSLLLSLFIVCISSFSKERRAEDYYIDAYNKIGEMLTGDSLLSIKKAVFLAEWAYYEGRLNYATDFCEEIERIRNYVNLFYAVNNLRKYKTGKQIALTEYFLGLFLVMAIDLICMMKRVLLMEMKAGNPNLSLKP